MAPEKKGLGPGKRKGSLLSVVIILAAIMLTSILLLFEPGSWQQVVADPHSNRMLFILLMAVLPVFGVSIIIFLVFIGLKFGTPGGILISGLIMFFHMLIAYSISHSFLRPQVDRFIDQHHWARPRLPPGKRQLYAFLFVVIPGLPYAVKNYLLALTGLSFLHYLVICWSAQMMLAVPFIVLGEAVKARHLGALVVVTLMLVSGFWAVRWLRREFFSSSPNDV